MKIPSSVFYSFKGERRWEWVVTMMLNQEKAQHKRRELEISENEEKRDKGSSFEEVQMRMNCIDSCDKGNETKKCLAR